MNKRSTLNNKETLATVAYVLSFFIIIAALIGLVILQQDAAKRQTSLNYLQECQHLIDRIEAKASVSDHSTIVSNTAEVALIQSLLKQAYTAAENMLLTSSIKSKLKQIASTYSTNDVNASRVHLIKTSHGGQRGGLRNLKESLVVIIAAIQLEDLKCNKLVMFLLVTCGFLLTTSFITVTSRYYFSHLRPAQALLKIVQAHERGEELPENYKKSFSSKGMLHVLGTATTRLIESHKRSVMFIQNIGQGNFDTTFSLNGENDHFGKSLMSMQERLLKISVEEKRNSKINEDLSNLEKILKSARDEAKINEQVIQLLTKSISAGVGVFYTVDEESGDKFFQAISSYGFHDDIKVIKKTYMGEGQLGQLGIDRKTLVMANLPSGYVPIQSGLGSSAATHIIMVPLLFKDELYGAIELAGFRDFEDYEVRWLERAAESLGAHLFNQKINAEAKRQLEELANKQANELVEIHRLQKQTYNKLEDKLKEVEEEKIKNQAILEGCVDAVISFDEQGKIEFCNKAAEEILGYERKEIMQRQISELMKVRIEVLNGEIRPYLLSADLEKEITVRTEGSLACKNGETVDVLITSTQVQVHSNILFTFFIQKISVDLF